MTWHMGAGRLWVGIYSLKCARQILCQLSHIFRPLPSPGSSPLQSLPVSRPLPSPGPSPLPAPPLWNLSTVLASPCPLHLMGDRQTFVADRVQTGHHLHHIPGSLIQDRHDGFRPRGEGDDGYADLYLKAEDLQRAGDKRYGRVLQN